MKENKMKYEYEVLKVGDADAILIRHYIGNEQFIILMMLAMQVMLLL